MVISAVNVYGVILDYATLAIVMANFALGGAVAVFWQKGCPRWVTQGYLVAVSVIMAWILTKLPEWTSWALLVALAVYDLVRLGAGWGGEERRGRGMGAGALAVIARMPLGWGGRVAVESVCGSAVDGKNGVAAFVPSPRGCVWDGVLLSVVRTGAPRT